MTPIANGATYARSADTDVVRQFKEFVLKNEHPCLGAKSAFRNNAYRTGYYEEMNTLASTRGLVTDLLAFIEGRETMESDFATFVAFLPALPLLLKSTSKPYSGNN